MGSPRGGLPIFWRINARSHVTNTRGDDRPPATSQATAGKPIRRRPAPRTRSISPAARRSPTHQRIRLTRSSICWTDCSRPRRPRWISARPDTTEHIVIEFDRPQTISRLVYEVEETMRERTQEVRVEVSEDGGRSYRQILVQEYNFSPGEPPISAKNSASISGRSPISVSRLFQIRADPARRRSQRSASSLRRGKRYS